MKVTNIFIILIVDGFMSVTICEILNCVLYKHVRFTVHQLQLNKTLKYNYPCDISQMIYWAEFWGTPKLDHSGPSSL